MTSPCTETPGCEYDAGHVARHPCGQRPEKPGDPCRFCGSPVPDPPPCPNCWISLEGLPLADIKGLLALGGLSVEVPRG